MKLIEYVPDSNWTWFNLYQLDIYSIEKINITIDRMNIVIRDKNKIEIVIEYL